MLRAWPSHASGAVRQSAAAPGGHPQGPNLPQTRFCRWCPRRRRRRPPTTWHLSGQERTCPAPRGRARRPAGSASTAPRRCAAGRHPGQAAGPPPLRGRHARAQARRTDAPHGLRAAGRAPAPAAGPAMRSRAVWNRVAAFRILAAKSFRAASWSGWMRGSVRRKARPLLEAVREPVVKLVGLWSAWRHAGTRPAGRPAWASRRPSSPACHRASCHGGRRQLRARGKVARRSAGG